MSGAAEKDGGAAAGVLGAGLSGFAEAAGAVLATPSECREVMLGALSRCWEELRWVGRHLQPYADDPAEVFDHFETARASLERLLWAAGTAVPARAGTPTSVEGSAPATAEPAGRAAAAPGPVAAAPAAPDHVLAGEGAERVGPAAGPVHPGTVVPGPGGASPAAPPGDDGTEAAGASASASASASVDDPEREAGEALRTPAEAGAGVAPAAPARPPVDPLAGMADALGTLETKLLAEQVGLLPRTPLSAALRAPAGTTTTAERIAATWQRVHMALLRLPAHLRDEWRAQARETAAAAGLAVAAEDSSDPDVIVPGLPQGLCAAERIPLVVADPGAAAVGVREEIHHKLGTSSGTVLDLPSTDPRPIWAVRTEQALRLVALDPELHIAVMVEDQPSSLSSEETRLRYHQRLNSLLESAGSSQADGWPPDSRLGAAHELDMVLGGLVHKRPAALDSWWWQWRTVVSEILVPLAERARYERVPKAFAKWTPLDVDAYTVKNSVPGQNGEPLVQWVLWTPLKPKGGATRPNERKGRIVMRPQKPYGWQGSS
ncbi:hypothetical protein [Streptomyces erythrochromogenes]|uniref:hypothetical protein n=1 Tax=Streptomyces erythrochromogenes TaxID=285574 RepID=UPI00382BF18E